jgi:pimeloyl-ACP methyl ester carboxylesterase
LISKNHLLCISGWSFGSDVFQPIEKKMANEFASVSYFPWQEGVLGKSPEIREPTVILGYSLGAFLGFPWLSHPQVRGGVFCGLAKSFVRSEENPKGTSIELMAEMKNNLRQNPQATLEQFRNKAFSESIVEDKKSHWRNLSCETDVEILTTGLDFLANASLEPHFPETKKIYLIQGVRDQILSYTSAKRFSTSYGLELVSVAGADHGILFTDPDKIVSVLKRLGN